MARLYPMLFFALLVLVVPVESAGQYGDLAKLSEVKILVEGLGSDAKELGVNEDNIKNHVFVFLRSMLPRLKVSESAVPYLYLNLNILYSETVGGKKTGYFGSIRIEIFRSVTINKTGSRIFSIVWRENMILNGPKDGAAIAVRDSLDTLLTKFAAAWYRDNP